MSTPNHAEEVISKIVSLIKTYDRIIEAYEDNPESTKLKEAKATKQYLSTCLDTFKQAICL